MNEYQIDKIDGYAKPGSAMRLQSTLSLSLTFFFKNAFDPSMSDVKTLLLISSD